MMTERITPRFGCGTPRKKDTMKFHTFSDATKFFDNVGTIDIILGGVCRRPRSGIGGRCDCKRRHNNDDNSPPPILGSVRRPLLRRQVVRPLVSTSVIGRRSHRGATEKER